MARLTLLTVAALAAACHHSSSGSGDLAPPTGPPPTLQGVARFQDVDLDGVAGPGDRIVLGFSAAIRVNTADPTALALPVDGDEFGAGASLLAGPEANEVTVQLGTDARLRTRGRFDPAHTSVGRASGVTVAAAGPADAIEDAETGVDAAPADPVDLVPEPVPGVQSGLLASALQLAGADLNRDGLGDWVAADGTNGVAVYESVPGGGYVAVELPVADAREVRAVDLFGAGRRDLVVRTADRLVTFENVSTPGGATAFALAQELPLPDAMAALADWDPDDDGDRDVVLAGESGLWLFENQDGVLSAPAAPLLSSPADGRDLAAGDVDRDGWEDLLVALAGPNALVRPLGCGGFELVSQGQGESEHVTLVDLDRDGRLDAVAAGVGPIEVWSGAPGGVLEQAYDLPAEETHALAVADLDGDGWVDLLHTDGLATRLVENDGTGLLEDRGVALPTGDVTSIALADVDADGDLDLGLTGPGGPEVWAASRTGTWGDPRMRESNFQVGAGPLFALAIGDLDQDGLLDVVVGRSHLIEIWPGQGDGSFGGRTVLTLDEGRAHDLALGDVDGDGDLDLVAAILGQAPNLWLNQDGAFVGVSLGDSGVQREISVALVDLDGDRFPELVLGTTAGHPDRVHPNGGGDCSQAPDDRTYWQGFEEPFELPGTFATTDVAAGDVDLDGDLDLLFAHDGDTPDRLFLNDGTGGLTLSSQAFPAGRTTALTLDDVDRDGDPDLVAAMSQGNLLFHGDGAGGFTQVALLDGKGTTTARLLRLDGDALPDLLAGNDHDHGWHAFRGTPDGELSGGTWQHKKSFTFRTLATGDLDRDGASDFVAGSAKDQPNRIWLSR